MKRQSSAIDITNMRTSFIIRGVLGGIFSIILILTVKSWLGFLDESSKSASVMDTQNMDAEMSISAAGGQPRSPGEITFDKIVQLQQSDEGLLQNDPRHKLSRKIVHLDLKGMPPKISYLSKLFPLLKLMGVTGILVEYEDMFPYHGSLASIANKKAYTPKEIAQLNGFALENNLEVIPLLQTFGHMEFVLKLESNIELREVTRYPQVLCPSDNRSIELVKIMIDQVMSLHPEVSQLHIGSDEVYYLGLCPRCISRMSQFIGDGNPKADLFLHHVKSVAEYVINKHKKRVMMWDDEFRQLDEVLINSFQLGPLVDIVVWNYKSDVETQLDSSLWGKYKRLFPSIWIGSAFKGADRPDSMVVNEGHYLANHYSWIRTLRYQAPTVDFQGIILTGWQRFDHFSVLCEIIGVAIPSLMSCMTYLTSTRELPMERVFELSNEKLRCQSTLGHCAYPASNLYDEVSRLQKYKLDFERLKSQSAFRGWAHSINLRNQLSNTAIMENIYSDISRIMSELSSLSVSLEVSLKTIYPDWSVREWMLTHFQPTHTEIQELYNSLTRILERITFPVRPFVFNETSDW